MLSRSATDVTSCSCLHFLKRPHFKSPRRYIILPHVRIASCNAHSNSSLESIAFRGGRWPGWSQSDYRRLSSSFGQSTAAASMVYDHRRSCTHLGIAIGLVVDNSACQQFKTSASEPTYLNFSRSAPPLARANILARDTRQRDSPRDIWHITPSTSGTLSDNLPDFTAQPKS